MYAEAVEFFKVNHITYCDLVQGCFKDRLATQETELLSQAITSLATHGWEKKTTVIDFGHFDVQALSLRLQVLQSKHKLMFLF